MTEPMIIDVLNELLAAERSAPSERLIESIVFISPAAAEDSVVVRRMAEQSQQHAAWLTEVILQLGGSPGLRVGDVMTAGLHFVELRSAMPYLLTEVEGLVRKYHAASARVSSEPQAAEVIGKILARHEENRLAIKARCDEPAGASA
jgi:bacterioferritin (cytochrome b1)